MFWRRDRHSKTDEAALPPADDELIDDEELPLGELDGEDEELDEGEEAAEDAEALEAEPEDLGGDLEAQAAEFLADNDVWMYGENAVEAMALIDRLEEVGPDDALVLVDAWRAVPKTDREVARKATRRMAEEDLEVERHLRLARESVGNWMAVAADYPGHLRAMPEWPRLCAQAGEAALDALTGIILRADLDEADLAALVAPWTEMATAMDAAQPDEAVEEAGAAAEPGDEEDEEALEAPTDGKFGPNTEAVIDLLNRLWLLTPEQVGRLVANWQRTPRDAREQAHAALHELVEQDAEWRGQVMLAQDQLNAWLNAGAREETSAYLGRTGQGEVHKNAGPALADAVAALVLGDLLDREDAETLYDPWLSLVGAPPLPEQAPEPEDAADEAAEAVEIGADEPDTEPEPAAPEPAPAPAKRPAKKGR